MVITNNVITIYVLTLKYSRASLKMRNNTMDDEATYHFTLSAMKDLIARYGYCNVLNDLDAMIEDEVEKLLLVVKND